MIYEPTQNVREARGKYFELNGIPNDGGERDRWARYKIGSFVFIAFPNFEQRRQAILRHDLHHVMLNLDTAPLGEGLIAAWELGGGCGKYWISWCMEPQALWWGILLAPRRSYSLFLDGKHSSNLFSEPDPERFLNSTVGELRSAVGRAPEGASGSFKDLLLFSFYAVMGLLLIFAFVPVFVFFTIVGPIFDLIKARG